MAPGWGLVLTVFFFFLGEFSWHVSGAFTPADSYYIVCGSTQKVTAHGQDYVPDSDHSAVSLDASGDGALSVDASSVPSPIYASLRFFPSPATYRFQIRRPGRHWLRLFFSAAAASSAHDLAAAPITAVAAGFVLMENFLPGGNQSSLKEFILAVPDQELALTFLPAAGRLAYVCAIELVSAPDDLVPAEAAALPGGGGAVSGPPLAALETAFRLNVGGPAVTPENDTLGRSWATDGAFLHVPGSAARAAADPAAIRYPPGGPTPETAPVWVYATADAMGEANVTGSNFNMTWVFPAESGFAYLVRLHFCDIVSRAMNTLVFNVYLNSALAVPSLDLSALRGALAVPYYKDLVCNATAAAEIIVSVGPDPLADLANAILNGVEVMKLANAAGSLAGGASAAALLHPVSSSKRRRRAAVLAAGCAAAALAVAALCAAVGCAARRRRRRGAGGVGSAWLPLALHGGGGGWSASLASKASSRRTAASAGSAAAAAQRAGRKFTLAEMEAATGRWDEAAVLGVGGFGRVYRGTLDDGTRVAVKRGNPRSEQGLAEFQTEIEMLSRLRHRHLVSLIGHCDDRAEMILVYEYMANGPLRSHLYGGGRPPLPWRRRLEICIGAARGLHYLHTGAAQSVIHRDVKTTNILLDEQLVAKVADFGLSKAGPALDQTHVSTAVKGSFGYLDPEYFRRQQLTDKSDVYSLGVVLMEVLCARPALDPALPREQVNLAEWAMGWQRLGRLAQIVDPTIAAEVSPASLRKFGDTAEKCLAEHAADRPAMGDVLWNLEYALQLQEAAAVADDSRDSSTNHIAGLILDSSSPPPPPPPPPAADEGATASAVFSQLVNPRGR
ncbi:protein kinase family protein [Wolffia australiana]